MTDIIERDPAVWEAILAACGVHAERAERHAAAFSKVIVPGAFSAGEEELDDFLGQILHESGMLASLRENCNYSAKRLRAIGFAAPVSSRWRAAAMNAERIAAGGPEGVANFLYADRMGNGDEHSGDGWRYRGGGHLMLTGLEAYRFATSSSGVDLVSYPELIEEPPTALLVSVGWWEGHVPDACIGDLVKVTKRVNGGTIGIAHREEITVAARKALEQFT